MYTSNIEVKTAEASGSSSGIKGKIMRALSIFKGPSGILLAVWLLSALIATIVPASIWSHQRNEYYKYVGVYNYYAQQQRQYEQQQNNNNNGNYNYNNWENPCSWWNFSCRKKYANLQKYYNNYQNNNNNRNGENQIILPGWYHFLGGKVEVDDREREEMGMTSDSEGSIKFVYSWTLVMFFALIFFGFRVLHKGKDRVGLIALLILYINFLLLNLLTVVNGVIETEARKMEESVYGWSGQWGVLVAYTDFWFLLHSLIFACVLGVPICMKMRSSKRDEVEEANDEAETGDYDQGYDQMA